MNTPSSPEAIVIDSPAYAEASPVLSVATPFFHYDPTPLLRRLATMAKALAGKVEIVLLDDGSGDDALVNPLAQDVAELEAPVRLVILRRNLGRSEGRNRLFAETRGRHVLFLDCDMAPDSDDFLEAWVRVAETRDAPVAVGGFSLLQTRPKPSTQLHHALQARGECPDAATRSAFPEKYVYTSNLLVRRDVFASEPFDPAFHGWGWEDVEWGARVAARFGVLHIDNTASHLGLDGVDALLGKYEQAGANFTLMVQRHGALMRRFPSYRLASALAPLPGKPLARAVLKSLARSEGPLAVRVAAAKLFRALVYAQALRGRCVSAL